MTLELWSDPQNDGESSCCSAQAVRGARELAHGSAWRTCRSTCARSSARASSTAGWRTTAPGSRRTRACAATATCASTRCSSSASASARDTLATGHYARVQDGRLLRMASRRRQGPELRALGALAARRLRALRFPLGAMHKHAGARAGARGRPGGRAQARLAGPVLPRRHAPQRLPRAPRRPRRAARARSSTRAAPCSASTAARTPTPSASATAWASARREPLYVLQTDTRANTVTVGPRSALLAGEPARARADAAPRRRLRRRRARALARAALRLPRCARGLGAGRHARASIELAEPAERTAPGPDRLPVRRRAGRRLRHDRLLAAAERCDPSAT